MRHRFDRIQHAFIHINIDDLSTIFHLLTSNTQGFLILLINNHASKSFGTRHIGSLTYVHIERFFINDKWL